MNRKTKKRLVTGMFLFPALFIFVNVVIIPFVMGLVYSFTDWDGFSLVGTNFVGLENYIRIFKEEKFVNSFMLSFKFTFLNVILVNVGGLALALLVTQKFKGAKFLRAIYFMPNLIGGLILGFIWQFIFSNLFVQLGEKLGLTNIFFDWLDDPDRAFWALVIVGVWRMSGYVMIIYIAAIQNIPNTVIEASKIDGANVWQRFRSIMLPLMVPAFTIGLFFTVSNSFKQYDINLALTNGGPYGTTELITMNIYNTAFSHHQYALAQAKSIIFFVVIMVISVLQVSISKRKEVEM